MPNQATIRIIEIFRFLYQYTDDTYPITVSDINEIEVLFKMN